MPRSTAKSRQNVNGNANAIQKAAGPPTDMPPKATPRRRTAVKREPGSTTECVTEQVFHRKSERRRVARDIFLVFEEQPSTRRSRGSNKKQGKPKFGHLKVEDTIKTKGLLRDIKNEPKCYLGNSATSNNASQIEKVVSKKKLVNSGAGSNFKVCSSPTRTSHNSSYSNAASREFSKESQEIANEEHFQAPKVNPIFLWAKQDNSRIIEVRCEDYDKRNRIRITKTSNGWRAIPRSDPTSSKILKLYTTPLIKVKRENHINELSHISQANSLCNVKAAENKPVMVESEIVKQDVFPDPIDVGIRVNEVEVSPKSPSRKSKKKKSKKRKRVFTCKKATIKINVTNLDDGDLHKRTHPNGNFDTEVCMGEVAKIADVAFASLNSSEKNSVANSANVSKTPKSHDGHLKISSPASGSGTCKEDNLLDATYHKTTEDSSFFQLCPKTGLFLRNVHIGIEDGDEADDILECSVNNSAMLEQKIVALEIKPNSADENNESLEAKTRNLKDLLDDADLFQHCDDNANSDSELIDTLVKSSCESNLIPDNETVIKGAVDSLQSKSLNTTGNHIVNDPPKCLSFNEAGEIEALNCELFHPNEYIDSFEKHPSTTITDLGISDNAVVTMQTISLQPTPARESTPSTSNVKDNISTNGVNMTEESPKDLSYKKREEVCPPSESRSQCAVTSSSDVVKSPNLDETSVLASSSETLKNLILEQFMKLNTISSHQKSPAENRLPTNAIETVVIDDDDSANEELQADGEEEPLKKRLRSSTLPIQKKVDDVYNIKSKMVIIDKDPDPLTQLRLLIRNSQWKVPDPILVPKDRLSAVLASPAREIPLLITTRPELRLPEAFAYPEIIQNPNILVISMAQLEAILKNDLEVGKSNDLGTKPMSQNCKQISGKGTKYVNDFVIPDNRQPNISSDLRNQHCNDETSTGKVPMNKLSTSNDESAKCSHIDSSLSSDINAATMAVLNQMLWLPYFGQISQEFMKYVKTPHSLSQKVASLLPKANGVQHSDIVYDKSKRNQMSSASPNDNPTLSGVFTNAALSSMLKQGQSEELTLFQKIVQHQMQNVLNLSQVKNSTTESAANTYLPTHCSTTEQTSHHESTIHNMTNIEPAKDKNAKLSSNNKEFRQNEHNTVDATEKTYNLRSSIPSRQSSESNQYPNIKRPNADNKPRLTCKSLSNLLDPEHNQPQNMSSSSNIDIPCVSNVDATIQKSFNGIKDQCLENSMARVGGSVIGASPLTSMGRQLGHSRSVDSVNDLSKQKNKPSDNTILENSMRNGDTTTLSTETNIPLWHPLFGSNSKSAYSSPWQWTTVTAAGE